MFDSVIKLQSTTTSVNKYGDTVSIVTTRSIFAEERSIGQSEFYQAMATGLKPEIKFVIADFLDYQGEKTLLYTPYGGTEEEYTILRTYRNNNNLEIVCKRGIDE